MPFWASPPARERREQAMLTIHKTVEGKMTPLNSVTDGCWVNLINPSEDELKTVAATLAVEPSFLRAALDEEEASRIDSEDGCTLIIVDTPAMEQDETGVVYSTLPMGIIVTSKHIITVCLKETSVVRDLQTAWCGTCAPSSAPGSF